MLSNFTRDHRHRLFIYLNRLWTLLFRQVLILLLLKVRIARLRILLGFFNNIFLTIPIFNSWLSNFALGLLRPLRILTRILIYFIPLIQRIVCHIINMYLFLIVALVGLFCRSDEFRRVAFTVFLDRCIVLSGGVVYTILDLFHHEFLVVGFILL